MIYHTQPKKYLDENGKEMRCSWCLRPTPALLEDGNCLRHVVQAYASERIADTIEQEAKKAKKSQEKATKRIKRVAIAKKKAEKEQMK